MQDLENYKKEKLTINIVWANVFGILILIPIIIVFGLPYYLLWKPDLNTITFLKEIGPQGFILRSAMYFGLLILGIVLHELIHGIVWAKYAKNGFKSIKFGVLWTMLTPYCHCKETLNVRQYIIGAISPAIILGILPSIIAIVIGNLGLLLFGIFFTMAAAGDFLVINLIRKEDKNSLVQDHPSEAGCFIYRKVDEKSENNNS